MRSVNLAADRDAMASACGSGAVRDHDPNSRAPLASRPPSIDTGRDDRLNVRPSPWTLTVASDFHGMKPWRMPRADFSTAREDSHVETLEGRLTLDWTWPRQRREALRGARLQMGRNESCGIVLPGNGVSRNHAELYRQGPLYVLRDLGSTNGTWLGGRRVEHAPVAPGSVIRIGDWVGVFEDRTESDEPFGELAAGLFGGSELAAVMGPLRRGARGTLPVLLVGPTGVGKERLANAAHALSGRSGPFVAVNCASIPDHLAEAELFGYRRGAFTGAERSSLGHFRSAHGGTLFLDEVPDLPLGLQAKLLRVLEDGQVLGLGEALPTQVDVRIVAASQSRLRDLVERGKLRQDLAARLSGIEIVLPPLRQRRADVAPLFCRFLHHHSGGMAPSVEARLIEALCLYDWPDNVRELELLARRLLALHGHEPVLRRRHLPGELAGLNQEAEGFERAATAPRSRREHDVSRLKAELDRNGGNVKAASVALGISRQRVYRLMDALEPPESEAELRG
jgi:transcriptional regulator with AAA-type ATPase domain